MYFVNGLMHVLDTAIFPTQKTIMMSNYLKRDSETFHYNLFFTIAIAATTRIHVYYKNVPLSTYL